MELNEKKLFPEVQNPELLQYQLVTKKDLLNFSNLLIREIQLNKPAAEPLKKWLRSVDVRNLLNISSATLQNFRVNNSIKYTRIGSIFYYSSEDIQKILDKTHTQKP
ncbi:MULTISPECIES: DNA-binding protein [unclassified Flavobacterium]|jgi:hypothetical protein|uniref:DNA-binding protein n=1 Tax=unclassified Flavobacterium TaxID=196869 RepID=UPI0025C2F62C|nr:MULTISPECIES: DNA-binding protein [unclassified Flavobacterium]